MASIDRDTDERLEQRSAGGMLEELSTQSEDGVVLSAKDDEIIIERENGSLLKLELKPSVMAPTEGQHVTVHYRYENKKPVVVRIEED